MALESQLLSAAEELAREAGAITLRHFGRPLSHSYKDDGSPVTVADQEAEAAIRRKVEARYPSHGIIGEECGESNEGADVRWIIDPIDGTLSFMRGVPLYAVLIGIEIQGTPAVGVAHFPALSETVAAARGLGCTWNGDPCTVSRVSSLSDAAVSTTDEKAIAAGPYREGWRKLRRRCRLSRTWGDAYGHALVATGRIEIQVDPVLNLWDAAPLLPIISEAGGRFTDIDGNATVRGGSGVGSNGILHHEALDLLVAHGKPPVAP